MKPSIYNHRTSMCCLLHPAKGLCGLCCREEMEAEVKSLQERCQQLQLQHDETVSYLGGRLGAD